MRYNLFPYISTVQQSGDDPQREDFTHSAAHFSALRRPSEVQPKHSRSSVSTLEAEIDKKATLDTNSAFNSGRGSS